MSENFKDNRLKAEELIKQITQADAIPAQLVYDVQDEFEVEIDIEPGMDKSELEEMIQVLVKTDDQQVKENKKEAEKSDLAEYNFLFFPSWVEIKKNKIKIGYWGEMVNSSYDIEVARDEKGIWHTYLNGKEI